MDVQVLLFDNLLHQVARLDDFYLVVEFARHGNHAERLHVFDHAAAETALFGVALFDQHRGVDVIDRCLEAEVYKADNQCRCCAPHNPGPVHQVFHQDGLVVYGLFFFIFERVGIEFFFHCSLVVEFW